MALIQTVEPEQAEGQAKEIYDTMQDTVGVIPAPLQLASASSWTLGMVWQSIQYYSQHPNLGFGLLSSIRYLVAQHYDYAFCINFNKNFLLMQGMSEDDIEKLVADPLQAPLDDKDRAMLDFVMKAIKTPDAVGTRNEHGWIQHPDEDLQNGSIVLNSSEHVPQWDEEHDVVVLGAGTAGLTAAIVSAIEGQRTLLIEKSDQIGGTSALSSGSAWIPNNSYQRRSGITGDAKAALEYLDALVGDRSDRKLREVFIAAGPDMLAYLEQHIDLRWLMYDVQPDYDQGLSGATTGGRALMPLPFDGRTLGKDFDRLRGPIPEFMLFGGMMITRGEAARLLRIGRNLDSFLLGAKLCGRYILDRMRYKRGTRLVLGNALVAHLFKNLRDRQTTIWYNAKTTRLISQNGRACGLVVQRNGTEVCVRANHGIVLAGGGFPASPELRERYFPKPVARYTSAYEGCTGDIGSGNWRLTRFAGGGQRALVSKLDCDPQGRINSSLPTHRPGSCQTGADCRKFGGSTVF
jgi:hypothetical protein